MMDSDLERVKVDKKSQWLSAVKWLWLVLVICGAVYYFYVHKQEVLTLISEISLWRITASLVILLIGKCFIVFLVQFSIQAEGWHQSFIHSLGLFGITSMGKYIPGGVWHFVGRIGAYRLKGLTSKQIMRSFILENYWLLSSALAVGLLAMVGLRFNLISSVFHISISSRLQIFFALVILLAWVVSLVVLKRWMDEHTVQRVKPVLKVMVVGILLWTFIGLSFYVMFPDFEFSQVPLFIGGYALSWAVGYVAIFAPGGLGVREAVLAWMFTSVAPVETIAVYAAMNRIIWLVAELTFGMVGIIQKQEIMPKFPQKVEIQTGNEQEADEPDLPETVDASRQEF